MIFGLGIPKVQLMLTYGTSYANWELPRPNYRTKTPYFTEYEIVKNVLGELIKHRLFYRYKDRLTFINIGDSDLDHILQIASWNEKIILNPYSSHIFEQVIVTDIICGPHNGILNYNDVEIEFTGVNRRIDIPRSAENILTVHGGISNRQANI